MNQYSQSKAAWHLDRISELRAGRVPAPVHVQLILSDLCNQDCAFCAYRMSGGLSTELFGTAETHNPNRRIPTEKAEEIIRDCARVGVRAIQFTGGGEPTVHPAHLQLFALAQELGLETALVSNGVKLDPLHRAVLGMRWIRISVDAGTEATYCAVRRVAPAHWRKLWTNIENLAALYLGRLGVGFVVTPENYRELAQCVELCAANGVPSVRVGAVFSEHGRAFYGDLDLEIRRSIDAAKRAAEASGVEVIDLFDRRIGDLETGAPRSAFCGYQHLTSYIGADLGVYRCCNTAYTRRGKIASLEEQSFAAYLTSRRLMDGFDARGCKFCQFLGQNAVIESLASEPADANFV